MVSGIGKLCIVKKNEHRPPLPLSESSGLSAKGIKVKSNRTEEPNLEAGPGLPGPGGSQDVQSTVIILQTIEIKHQGMVLI